MAVFVWLDSALNPWVPVIGYAAGALTTLSFLPQVIKVFRTKSADDLSLGMFIAFCLGVFLWLLYGLVLGSWPIIVTNFATLILSSAILFLKLLYDARRAAAVQPVKSDSPALAEVAEPIE